MKKVLSCLLAVIIAISLLAACSGKDKDEPGDGKLSIVAATFPLYDWLQHILGDRLRDVELSLLLDNGIDLHSYQPSVADIANISACDMFIHVGGESDVWIYDALETARNDNMTVINLMKVLSGNVKQEEIIEGMDHDHEDEDDHDLDEHVWLSLKNAQIVCAHISKELGTLDVQSEALYAANAEAYCEKLRQLDAEYQEMADGAAVKTLLFGDRFPFRYLLDDYGIDYYAAFPGCSAETEASFGTIAFLAEKTGELGLQYVMVLEASDGAIARTIIDNTQEGDQGILTLDSMQSVTAGDISSGVTYLSIMRSNLEVLKEALG